MTKISTNQIICELRAEIKALKKENAELKKNQKPPAGILHIISDTNADGDVMEDLTGRIIFIPGDNFGEKYYGQENTYTIDFYCGPETKAGYLLDYSDCGLYDQLEKLFKESNLEVSIGDAENYHSAFIPDGSTANDTWDVVKSILKKAGAVEKGRE